MPTFYIDETGYTGEDLLSQDQPLFAQSSNDFTVDEAKEIIDATFGGVNAKELKHARLRRSPRHRDGIIKLVRILANDPARAATWISHKEFALVTLIVDWWMEPLARKGGLNLYKDGANLGMANMLFACLAGFWSQPFRRKLLMHFQLMIRSRTAERFAKCEAFVRKETAKVDDDRAEILRYFGPSFTLLGLQHVRELPKQVLDIAFPGLVFIGNIWRGRHEGPWDVVHDQSSNLAKQKWMWDALSSPDLSAARFDNAAGTQIFPMNVSGTRFADSVEDKQLQICDILAGATSAYLRFANAQNDQKEYSDKLSEAGIEKLIVGGLWPSTDVTPEALGMKGWDGNAAIEWITEQLRAARQ